jgi:plastocyanin
MRRLSLVLVAGCTALMLTSAGAPAGVADVSVNTRGFQPATLTLRAGDTVTWSNTGSLRHQIVSNTGAFPASPVLQPGQSWSFTFSQQGRFAYHDALHPSLKAAIVVAAPPPSVTIGSARQSVTYGGTGITLSGRVSSEHPGEPVQVIARACGRFAAAQIGVVTRGHGIWRLVVHPARTTVYGARWGTVASPAHQVSVLARVRLARAAGGFAVRVTAGTSLAGRTILLQRRDETEQSWGIAATAKLRTGGAANPPGSFASVAAFKSPGGGRVRALLSAAQAAPCYAQSASNVLGG